MYYFLQETFFCAYPKNASIELKQPDGSIIHCYLKGFIVQANTLHITRSAIVTITGVGIEPQIITLKQDGLNIAPIANAGTNQTVNEGATVTLDGSNCFDPDGDTLTYKWTTPSSIYLSSNTISKPTFATPDIDSITSFIISLIVNDGSMDSESDTVIVTVKPVFNIIENKTICEGDSYKGWTAAGQHIENLTSVTGCDSIVMTNLSFYPTYQPSIEINGDTLIVTETYQSYQWYDINGEIPGATNNQYIISKSGEYYLVFIDDNGCKNESNPVQAVYSAIESISLENFKYSIIPNPNRGKFTFRIDSKPEDNLILKLVNSIGQLIEVREIKSTVINHVEQFDVSYLSTGIYHLVIISEKFQSSEKIMVQ